MRPVDDADFNEADEQYIRDLLAAEPRPQMPPEVARRIDAALAAEPPPDFAEPAQSGRWPLWVGGGVAAALVLVAAALLLPQVLRPAPAPTLNAGPTGGVTPVCNAPMVYDTGTKYQQAALVRQASALVPDGTCSTGSTGGATQPGADSLTTTEFTAPVPAPETSYEPEVMTQLVRCVVRVARNDRVMFVDRGSYNDRPAVVAVVEPPRRALVVNCSRQPERLLFQVRLSR